MNGVVRKVDDFITLDHNQEKMQSIKANLRKLEPGESTAATPAGSSVLASIVPGQQITDEQKEKLAKENLAATVEAQALAADQRTRDIAEGRGEPAVNTIADAIKSKLERDEFENTPPADTTPAE